MNNQNKDQVRSQIMNANNILVAVSANPTVDELAASIGLTLALNKLDKHATTVFSGQVPSTIEFLQPEQTIETTTDSLRDFIIALDKSKADKLRYKVEDNVVRIFITPYRTSISQEDLNFSQGDFNVDLVVALGVERREDLDAAITAHGRILHDATVLSISNSEQTSELGSIHWQESQASSLCEMVTVVTSELQQNIIDGQMATAFLTGIVAETDRFKNEKTSALTLSLSSQLMSAGANQQLIVQKLEPQPIPEVQESPAGFEQPQNADNEYGQNSSEPQLDGAFDAHPAYAYNEENESVKTNNDGSLSIDHNEEKDEVVKDIHIDEQGTFHTKPAENQEQGQAQQQSDVTPLADVLQNAEPLKDNSIGDHPYQPVASSAPVPMPPLPQEELDTEPSPNETGNEEVHNEYLSPNNASDPTQKNESVEDPTIELPKTDSTMMKHKRVIQPSGDSKLAASKKMSDKPFDLNEAEETPGIVPQLLQSQPTPPQEPSVVIPPPLNDTVAQPEPSDKSAKQTLSALEEAVDSHHVSTNSTKSDEPNDLDLAALQEKAANAADAVTPQFPTPQQAMQSSTPMSIEHNQAPEEKNKSDEADKVAPPVPPPMAPQFFDADGNNQNPLLNPN